MPLCERRLVSGRIGHPQDHRLCPSPVASPVAWQTTTIALVGILFGVPLGIALVRLAWRAFAQNLGVTPIPVVSVSITGLIVLGTREE